MRTGEDMSEHVPGPPPAEAVLIRLVRQASGKSAGETAAAGGLSKSRLSQVEAGHQGRASGYRATVLADGPLARIAAYLNITPEELDEAGRRGAADVLRMIARRPARAEQDDRPQLVRDAWDDPQVRTLWGFKHTRDEVKLGMIADYLAARDNADEADGAEVRDFRAAR